MYVSELNEKNLKNANLSEYTWNVVTTFNGLKCICVYNVMSSMCSSVLTITNLQTQLRNLIQEKNKDAEMSSITIASESCFPLTLLNLLMIGCLIS